VRYRMGLHVAIMSVIPCISNESVSQ
jgi:hypothetical protein